MNLFRYILPIVFTIPSVHAADAAAVKFVSLAACKNYYTTSVTASSGQNADTYCKDKILGFIDACIETKVNQYLTSIKAAMTDLSNTEQISIKSKYKYECQVANQKEVQAAQAKVAATTTATGSGSASNSANTTAALVAAAAASLAASKKESKPNTAQAISQATQQLAKSPTGSTAKAQVNQDAANPSGQAITGDAIGSKSAVNPSLTPAQQTTTDSKTEPQKSEAHAQNEADIADRANPYSANYVSAADAQSDAVTAQNQIAAAAQDAKTQVPQASEAIKKLEQAAKVPSTVPGNITPITKASETTSAKLNENIFNTVSPSEKSLQNPSPSPAYSLTLATLKKIATEIRAYTETPKKSCTKMAETASMLCVEGTSDGAKFAKEVMEVSGPVLAVISSAQKTCSSTAKVTRVVNLGLTIAKGVCIAAKLTCDQSCKSAVTTLAQFNQSIETQLTTSITNDWSNAEAVCHSQAAAEASIAASSCMSTCYKPAYDASYIPCSADNSQKRTAASALIGKLKAAVATENSPTPGTSPAIAAGCQNHVKDIALFALQVYGTAAAQKSAQACADKLASSTAGATAVTTQQFCEKAANVKEQLCVCQANNMAAGCPGAIAAGTTGTQEKGTNIQATKGNSGFAGGFAAPGTATGAGLGLGSKGAADGLSAKASEASGLGGGGGGFAGGGAGGGAAGAVPTSSEEPAAKKAEENKKWSFGSFAGMGGGMSGMFGGANAGKGSSGSLGEKDMDAVKREIASEKVAREVSAASGKSNWEKVRNMYLIKEASFLSK